MNLQIFTDKNIFKVPFHLMAQCNKFQQWENLGADETFGQDKAKPFVFPLNDITTNCLDKIVEWMENHNGQQEPVVKKDPITTEASIFVEIGGMIPFCF